MNYIFSFLMITFLAPLLAMSGSEAQKIVAEKASQLAATVMYKHVDDDGGDHFIAPVSEEVYERNVALWVKDLPVTKPLVTKTAQKKRVESCTRLFALTEKREDFRVSGSAPVTPACRTPLPGEVVDEEANYAVKVFHEKRAGSASTSTSIEQMEKRIANLHEQVEILREHLDNGSVTHTDELINCHEVLNRCMQTLDANGEMLEEICSRGEQAYKNSYVAEIGNRCCKMSAHFEDVCRENQTLKKDLFVMTEKVGEMEKTLTKLATVIEEEFVRRSQPWWKRLFSCARKQVEDTRVETCQEQCIALYQQNLVREQSESSDTLS